MRWNNQSLEAVPYASVGADGLPPPPPDPQPGDDVDPETVARAGLAPAPTGGQLREWSIECSPGRGVTRDVRRVFPGAGQRLRTKEVWDGQRWSLTGYDIEADHLGDPGMAFTADPVLGVDVGSLVAQAETFRHRTVYALARADPDLRRLRSERSPDLAEVWAD